VANIPHTRLLSLPIPAPTRDHRTIEGAVDRLAEAARSVIAGQIDVARMDVKVAGNRLVRSGALVVVGVLALGMAWTALMLAAYVHLAPRLSPEGRLVSIALAHGLFGLVLLLGGLRAMMTERDD